MKNDIAVTIGFPVYNVEKYIEKSLCSALQQDFDKPYEILVIDDRGNDKSMEIVCEMSANHPNGNRIRVIKRDSNQGVGEARNLIIEEAFGEYLFFLDPDDWISQDCLSVMYRKALLYNCDVVAGSYKSVSAKGEIVDILKLPESNRKNISLHCGGGNEIYWQIAVWNKLYRLDFIRQNNIRCVYKFFEDVIFDYKLRLYVNSVAMIPNVTLSYLIRPASLTDDSNKNPTDEMIQTYSDIICEMGRIASDRYNVDGIWDYYVSNIRSMFAAVCRKNFTKDQMKFFNKSVKGYMDIIPSYKCLNSNTHKMLYLLNYIKSDYKTFLWLYEKMETLRTMR